MFRTAVPILFSLLLCACAKDKTTDLPNDGLFSLWSSTSAPGTQFDFRQLTYADHPITFKHPTAGQCSGTFTFGQYHTYDGQFYSDAVTCDDISVTSLHYYYRIEAGVLTVCQGPSIPSDCQYFR